MTQSFDVLRFRSTLSQYPTGVVIVTAIDAEGEPVGMVVGSFTSVSLDPPLVGFFAAKSSQTFTRLRTARSFCINVLAHDQEWLCRRFASRAEGKFDDIAWKPGPLGNPQFDGVLAWAECETYDVSDAGDHSFVMGTTVEMEFGQSALPLLFFQGGYGRFSSHSMVPRSHPDVLNIVRLAERARPALDALASAVDGDASIVGVLSGDLVVVGSSGGASTVTTGSRFPFVAPIGAILVPMDDDAAISEWLMPYQVGNDDDRRLSLEKLRAAHERGYSIALRQDGSDEELMASWNEYSSENRTPWQERDFRMTLATISDLYDPDVLGDGMYFVRSIIVPIAFPFHGSPLGLRLGGLRQGVSLETITAWVDELQLSAQQISHEFSSEREVDGTPR